MNYLLNTILLYAITYILFFALLWLGKKRGANRLVTDNSFTLNPSMLLQLHIAGIILFGLLPLYLNRIYLAVLTTNTIVWSWSTLCSLLLTILALIIAPGLSNKKNKHGASYASTNVSFSRPFFILYFFIRFLFIVAYESWFRGYLLHDCLISLGAPLATVVNVCLYTGLHAVNGKDEMLACIPFGILLCSLCIWQGSAWPAIASHAALTMSYEISMIRKLKTNTLQHESFNNRGIWLHRQ